MTTPTTLNGLIEAVEALKDDDSVHGRRMMGDACISLIRRHKDAQSRGAEPCGGKVRRLSHGMNPRGVCGSCGGEKIGTVAGHLSETCENLFEQHAAQAQSGVDDNACLEGSIGFYLSGFDFITPRNASIAAEGIMNLIAPHLRTAQPIAPDKQGWMAIESAPKDARYVLGGWWDHGWNVDQCVRLDGGNWQSNNRTDGRPTHWKPWD